LILPVDHTGDRGYRLLEEAGHIRAAGWGCHSIRALFFGLGVGKVIQLHNQHRGVAEVIHNPGQRVGKEILLHSLGQEDRVTAPEDPLLGWA